MTLDSRFVIASDLQSLFRDKDTGLPLRNGVIYFWEDEARIIPKDVYKLSGSPPNYTYTNIGAVVNLTAAGTFSDNENPANDIVPYYFPYQGTPSQDTGITELYYVEVYSEGGKTSGVSQFTREAWPNIATAQSESQNLQNYIPNGQFKIHSNIPPDDTTTPPLVAGQIRQAVTNLAQGGWTFERPNASAAKDIVLFDPFGSYVTNPPASPTYFIDIANQSPSAGDAYKDLRIKFNDVNKFASDTQLYTFAFWGQSNGGSVNVSLILIKNFGTGGDTQEEIPIANFVITNSFMAIQKSGFTFGDNTGKVIGTQGDDFIQLALRFPTGSLFDVSLVDFILTPGSITITNFPQTTDSEFGSESIAPPVPAYDNSNLFLPMVLGPQGVIYDNACIGDLISETQMNIYVNSLHPTSNRMLADGNQYETAGYSPLSIPFSRLQQKYWDSTINAPMYGTGPNYFTAVYLSYTTPGNEFIITNNSGGSVSNTADGTPATGFTFTTIHTGAEYFTRAYIFNDGGFNTFYVQNTEIGTVGAAPSAGTSGFGIASIYNDDALLNCTFSVTTLAASGLAGKYFTFESTHLGFHYAWYVWFQVNGSGVDPAVPGHTGILVKLNSTDTNIYVAEKIREALNGWQITTITPVAAASIPPGAYFSINSTAVSYYVWYTIDGMGTDPAPASKKPILVALASTDTIAQVITKTQITINQKFFASPDVRGLFPRFVSGTSDNDPEKNRRWSVVPGVIGNRVGTFEGDTNQSHAHLLAENNYTGAKDNAGGTAGSTDVGTADAIATLVSGSYESRGRNIDVTAAVLY